MTDATTKIETTPVAQDGVIPTPPAQVAEIQPPAPGEATLPLQLTLSEMGAIAASLQTAVHAGWIKLPTQLNVANSVLRKFHDAKAQHVKENP